ncbi:MAG: hypothetical protein PHO74_07540 [Weeksellaceae bacterium]|nr:hypothetical protein [Weeksellaceae bacterium]
MTNPTLHSHTITHNLIVLMEFVNASHLPSRTSQNSNQSLAAACVCPNRTTKTTDKLTDEEEEANALLQSDPAIKNGLLDYEIFSWYGSAALPEYLPTSDKIWKSKP